MEVALCGFTNLGNTCYFNAAVQALLSMHSLNNDIFACIKHDPTTIKKACDMLVEYLHVFVSLVNPIDAANTNTIVNMAALHKIFVKNSPTINFNTQEDSHEALISLLNEFIDKKNEKILSKIFENNFLGKRQGKITCHQCKHSETFTDMFIDLSVPIPALQNATILDCINTYYTKEILKDSNSWFCSICNKHVQADIETTTIEPGKTFIVSLKRFTKVSNCVHKNTTNVEIFSTLRINNMLFKLIATINHVGSPSGGHYYANVSRKSKWFTADDSTISQCSPSTLSNPSVYIAIYQKI